MNAATQAGAAPVTLPHGTGRLIRTPLLSVLLVQSDRFGRTFLLVGFTSADLLIRAATDLLGDVDARFQQCFAPAQGQRPAGCGPGPPPAPAPGGGH